MALKKCKECGKDVSTKAKTCPNCGAPIQSQLEFNPRRVFWAILIGLFIIIGLAVQEKSESDRKKTSRGKEYSYPSVSMSATQLYKEYESNEVGADQKYRGRVLLVSGKVDNIGKDILDKIYITLETEHSFNSVQCFFGDKYKHRIANIQKGTHVSLKGRCRGKSMGSVLLKDCRF